MDSQQPMKRSRADKGIGRMILVSLVLHIGAIAVMVMAGGQRQLEPLAPKSYTVSLVDPIDLVDFAAPGGGLTPGREKAVSQQPKIPLQPGKKATPPPQVLPQVKEQAKEKPVKTVEKTPPPPKAVKVKPEPKKEVVQLAEKEKPKEEKKLKPKKVEKKDSPPIEKAKKEPEKKLARRPSEDKSVEKTPPPPKAVKVKPEPKKEVVQLAKKEKPKEEKKLARRPSEDKSVEKLAPTPKKTLKKADPPISDTERDEQRLSTAIEQIRKQKTDPPISDTERDEQRLSTAIEQIRKQVESNSKQSGQAGATQQARGNRTSGGSSSGGVQGLAFMMYTEQVRQRVKESWIVTQKKSGLTAVVEFGVMPSGDIVAVELAQSSGSNAFDQSVLRAVHKANPLPPPPQEYQQEFLSQKVKVSFGK